MGGMKKMRKIENFEEFLNLWNISHKNRYWGNKKITPEQEADIIARADQKDFKRYNIYMLKDNYHFIVIDTKYPIDKDLYYDDETPTPEVTLVEAVCTLPFSMERPLAVLFS